MGILGLGRGLAWNQGASSSEMGEVSSRQWSCSRICGFRDFSAGLVVKNLPSKAGHVGSIPG